MCRILRAVEASQREGGEGIARLGRGGRIQPSVCSQSVGDMIGLVRGCKDKQASEKRLFNDKAPH